MDENEPINNKMTFSLHRKRSRSLDIEEENQPVPQIANGVKGSVLQQRHNLSAAKQYIYIRGILKKIQDGESLYMLSIEWYQSWESYCTDTSPISPGEIDNSALRCEDGSVKPDLIYDKDFILLPEKGWKNLIRWYLQLCAHSC